MPHSNSSLIRKLLMAINYKDPKKKLTQNREQWFSKQQDRLITTYVIKMVTWNADRKKFLTNRELFRATSQIQIVLFLRDYWYTLNGKEIPTNNKEWESVKEKLRQKGIDTQEIINDAVNLVIEDELTEDSDEEMVYERAD